MGIKMAMKHRKQKNRKQKRKKKRNIGEKSIRNGIKKGTNRKQNN
jgi:hypothetical protein